MTTPKSTTTLVTMRPIYLARPQAAAVLSVSESTLDQLVAERKAPAPRQISAGRVAWLTEELEAWARERPVSELLPPKGSGHGRAGRPPKKAAPGSPAAH